MRFFVNLLPKTKLQAVVSFSAAGFVAIYNGVICHLLMKQQDGIRYFASMDAETFNLLLKNLPSGALQQMTANARNASPIPNWAIGAFFVFSTALTYFISKSAIEDCEKPPRAR
jgi:hypothetical protein